MYINIRVHSTYSFKKQHVIHNILKTLCSCINTSRDGKRQRSGRGDAKRRERGGRREHRRQDLDWNAARGKGRETFRGSGDREREISNKDAEDGRGILGRSGTPLPVLSGSGQKQHIQHDQRRGYAAVSCTLYNDNDSTAERKKGVSDTFLSILKESKYRIFPFSFISKLLHFFIMILIILN